MNKKIFTIILLIVLFSACGCGVNNEAVPSVDNNTEPAETAVLNTDAVLPADTVDPTESPAEEAYCSDYRIIYYNSTLRPTMAETDSSIYMLVDNIVYYTDKDYKDWMPLCARPDCKHKSEDCDAYIDSELLVLYGNHLYYVEGSGEHDSAYFDAKLCRMDLAGSQHEVLCDLPVKKPDFAPSASYWQIEATNRYLIVRTAFVGSSAVIENYYYAFDLDTLEAVPIFEDYLQSSGFSGFILYEGRGGMVYGDICYNDGTPYVIAEVDLSTGTVRELYEHERQFAYYERGVGLWEDKLYFIELNKISQGFYTEEDMQKLYALDINSLELTQVNEEQILIAKYRIFDSGLGYWYSPLYNSGENNGFYVYDMDGNLVDMFLTSDCPDGAKSIVIGRITDRYIFGRRNTDFDDNRRPEWYIDKSEIGTGSLMWHRWEP